MLEPAPPFDQIAALLPEAPEGEAEGDCNLRIGARGRPLERRPEVVMLDVEAIGKEKSNLIELPDPTLMDLLPSEV